MKAKYIGKRYGKGYDKNSVYLEYEYRGKSYIVHENVAKGNECLSWQHKSEQARIDSILDTPKPTGTTINASDAFDALFQYFETGEFSLEDKGEK